MEHKRTDRSHANDADSYTNADCRRRFNSNSFDLDGSVNEAKSVQVDLSNVTDICERECRARITRHQIIYFFLAKFTHFAQFDGVRI